MGLCVGWFVGFLVGLVGFTARAGDLVVPLLVGARVVGLEVVCVEGGDEGGLVVGDDAPVYVAPVVASNSLWMPQ